MLDNTPGYNVLVLMLIHQPTNHSFIHSFIQHHRYRRHRDRRFLVVVHCHSRRRHLVAGMLLRETSTSVEIDHEGNMT